MSESPETKGIRFGLAHLFWAVTLVCAGLALSLGSWVLSSLLIGKWVCKLNDQSQANRNWNGIHSIFNILIVLFCLGSALLLSASGSVKAAAKRSISQNNVRHIMLALHNYESSFGHLPKNRIVELEDGTVLEHSWRIELMPYLESSPVYEQYDFNEPWDGPNNSKLHSEMPVAFESPDNTDTTKTAYKFVTGPGTAFPKDDKVTFEDVIDGASNTVILIEDAANPVSWLSPEDLSPDQAAKILNSSDVDSIAHVVETPFSTSGHGTVVGLLDGSSRFVGANPVPPVDPGDFRIADGILWDHNTEGRSIVRAKIQGYLALAFYIFLILLPYFLFRNPRVPPESASK